MTAANILVFGLGYSGTAIATLARTHGCSVTATSRTPERGPSPNGVSLIRFADAARAVREATHIVSTVGPEGGRDPVLARFGTEIAQAPALRWAAYISTIGVYGDRGGAWVDEDAAVDPTSPRARDRIAVEQAWASLGSRIAVELCRAGGIYGPGRSALDEVRSGRARRVDKPGHRFNRIHRDDIALAVLAAALRESAPGVRVLHLVDDEPAESAAVIAEAASLLDAPLPPLVPFADAAAGMSPMGRAFWAGSRLVANAKTKAALGIAWRYPTYREGLRAILAEEGREQPG